MSNLTLEAADVRLRLVRYILEILSRVTIAVRRADKVQNMGGKPLV